MMQNFCILIAICKRKIKSRYYSRLLVKWLRGKLLYDKGSSTFQKKIFLVGNVSVQFSHSVVSNSLWPHEPQHARPPCPSPTPGVHSDSRPLSQWCHPAISSSVVPFFSCPQSLPASESFPMSQLFAGQKNSQTAFLNIYTVRSFIYEVFNISKHLNITFNGSLILLASCLMSISKSSKRYMAKIMKF